MNGCFFAVMFGWSRSSRLSAATRSCSHLQKANALNPSRPLRLATGRSRHSRCFVLVPSYAPGGPWRISECSDKGLPHSFWIGKTDRSRYVLE